MQIESQSTPIWLDVDRILQSKEPVPVHSYSVVIHTAEGDVEVSDITAIDIVRDYANQIADGVRLQVQVPLGDYITKLYPLRNNLEITITRSQARAGNSDVEYPDWSERYKAVFIPNRNQHLNLTAVESTDPFTLNNRPPVDVEFQLLNRTIEPLRIKTASGVFNKVDREELIRGILGGESARVMVDGQPGIDAMNIVQPDNKDLISQIVFPSFTPVLAIPTYIQERHNGVYSTGIGSYFQTYRNKRTWFVYPLYDLNRFKDTPYKLVIYGLNGRQFANADRTYRLEDKTLHVLATGERLYVDDGEAGMMNDGIGFRQTMADEIMVSPFEYDEKNGPRGVRTKLNTEVSFQDRADGLNYAPVSSREISNNMFAEASRISEKKGARLDLIWQNSDPALLYPGMPCKYVYATETEIKEVYGVLLFNQTLTAKKESMVSHSSTTRRETICSSTTSLVLFVQRHTETE